MRAEPFEESKFMIFTKTTGADTLFITPYCPFKTLEEICFVDHNNGGEVSCGEEGGA